MSEPPIRDAATVIVVRKSGDGPRVLMGQRGKDAAFMPSKFVFPGGAVDPSDGQCTLARSLQSCVADALTQRSSTPPHALAVAAIRELWEETGLVLAQPGPSPEWPGFPPDLAPDAAPLNFVFRAITPPGRSRRFDARFFLIGAGDLASDPDDFAAATDELSHLQWVLLSEARRLDVPFVTEVVLAEIAARETRASSAGIPFFDNRARRSIFRYL